MGNRGAQGAGAPKDGRVGQVGVGASGRKGGREGLGQPRGAEVQRAVT